MNARNQREYAIASATRVSSGVTLQRGHARLAPNDNVAHMGTTVIYDAPTETPKNRNLRTVPPVAKIEHEAVCSVDGEPWPCRHTIRESNFRMAQYHSVFCLACGKQRNAWASLSIERDLNGQAVYFHARKRCSQKAVEWWNTNVKPHTGEDLLIKRYGEVEITIGGQSIEDLTRYLSLHSGLKVATVSARK